MRHLLSLVLCTFSTLLVSQNEGFKLMTYNLMYYKDGSAPCSQSLSFSAKDAAFKKVFKAVDPDILCVNELVGFPDNSGAESVLKNVINTEGEVNFTSAGYTNNSFSSITNMVFFDSTRFALHSQSYLTNELNNSNLVRVIDFYRLYYKDPDLKNGADTVFFTLIAAHLKAGNSSADINERTRATEAVMDYLANNVANENVILTGDLNLYGNTEGAYQELTNSSFSSESFVDPGVAGSWNNNSLYAPLHTQSTHASGSGCYSGGGLDDRFDFILYSQAIATGSEHISYKANSLESFGNDGNHFNMSINSGTNSAVSLTIANALYDFSDHLPVIAEFEIDPPGIGISENIIQELIRVNNPVGDRLLISRKTPGPRLRLSIFDIGGRMIFKGTIPASRNQLQLNSSNWKPGVYLLHLSDDAGNSYSTKLIK